MAKDKSNASDSPNAGPSQTPPGETTKTVGPDASARILKRIGHYHVRRQLASGGMGTVYEATQDNPRRVVAIKLMRQGIASRSAMRRFEYESQILARLRHPGIAQIYEAGTHRDESGTVPYFAMEYIPNALSITNYAKEKKLGTRDKLKLFTEVCDAVHHGHQKGIIHRDLKPGNILVDSHGQVKVIDFGVARGTDSDLAVTTLQTDIGQLIGTLQYMSPEQCLADPHDIDTRSDVYALGVVLYELLSGRLPYKVSSERIFDGTRVIREQQPTKFTTVDKRLKGDIETVVFKALEKDRERRYRSAADLTDDLNRYLSGEAIIARPPSVAYQLRIFARRNKALAAGVTVAFVALTVGVIGTSIGLVKARAARERAEQVTAFLEGMIGLADPYKTMRPNVTVREALDQATETIGDRFRDKPLIEARLRYTIGNTYLGLGDWPKAELHLRAAIRLQRRLLGEEHPDTLSSMHNLGFVLWRQVKRIEAEKIHRRTVEARRRVLGDEHPDTLRSMLELGAALWVLGEYAEAERMHRRTLGIRRRVLGEEHPDTLLSMIYLALVLDAQERYVEAEALHRKTLAVRRRVLGDEYPDTLWSMECLGWHLRDQGRHAEAERLFRAVLPIRRRTLSDSHADTLILMNDLATCLYAQGKSEEARPFFVQLLEHLKRAAERPDASAFRFNSYAWLLLTCDLEDLRDPEAALPVAKKALEKGGGSQPGVLDTLTLAYFMTGDAGSAMDTARRAFGFLSPGWRNFEHKPKLARYLIDMGDFKNAECLLVTWYEWLADNWRSSPRDLRRILDHLVKLYEAWDAAEPGKGYADKAARYRAMLHALKRPESAEPIRGGETP